MQTENYNCMMRKRQDCPVKKILIDIFDQSEEYGWHKRAEMVTKLKPREEFFEALITKLENL